MLRFLKLCLTLLALLTFSLSIGRAADLKIGYYNKTATITMVGPIVRGDYDRFRQTVGKIADEGGIVTHLYIFSPGGLVNEALNIGRLAGKLALTTVAPTYDPAVPEKRQWTPGPGKCTYFIKEDLGDEKVGINAQGSYFCSKFRTTNAGVFGRSGRHDPT